MPATMASSAKMRSTRRELLSLIMVCPRSEMNAAQLGDAIRKAASY
jgi:hypothetical protein